MRRFVRLNAAVCSSRRGLSLLEVLIAMFVLAIGLLGIASLLPVGQLQIERGETVEQARNVSEAAFGTLQAGGWLNPTRWYDSPNRTFDAVDPTTGSRLLFEVTSSGSSSFDATPAPTTTSLAGSILEFRSGSLRGMRRRLASQNGATFEVEAITPLPAPPSVGDTFVVYRSRPFAIDPLYVAAHPIPQVGFRNFAGESVGAETPMRRITISQGLGSLYVATSAVAEHLCISQDDLSFTLADDPATTGTNEEGRLRQLIYTSNINGADVRLKRKSAGEFSWLATFVPPLASAGLDPDARVSGTDYVVSVAVFRNRLVRGQHGLTDDSYEVGIQFTGGGYGGGSALLSASNATMLDKVQTDNWILVWNTGGDTRAYNWYRVVNAAAVQNDGSTATRHVTLNGPDWDTSVLGSGGGAKLFVGLVGVYQRHMQVEQVSEL